MSDQLRRRKAWKDNVEYSDPVVLHESTAMRIEMVPWFIRRTSGDELAIKLTDSRPG